MTKLLRTQLLLAISLVLGAVSLLSGCGSQVSHVINTTGTVEPAPTVSAIFSERPTVPPVLASSLRPTVTPSSNTGSSGSAAEKERLPEIIIYDDVLSSAWALDQNTSLDYTMQGRDFVNQGRYAIRASTTEVTATLSFTVKQASHTMFRRKDVLGLRFKLGGGRSSIPNDAIAVSMIGSNQRPYWAPNDTSVKIEGRVTDDSPIFSETRLYFLNISHTIPPGEWADVYVWLDDLTYDPDYTYITGFCLKTDDQDRFYVDDVALILAP